MDCDPEDDIPLAEKLRKRLDDFLIRNAPRIRKECDAATLKITIMMPQGDDDRILWLDARVEEEVTTAEVAGRVPSVVWDPALHEQVKR